MPATKCATYPVITNGKKNQLFAVENERAAFKFVQTEYQFIMAIQIQIGNPNWICVDDVHVYTIISHLSTISCTKLLCFLLFLFFSC